MWIIPLLKKRFLARQSSCHRVGTRLPPRCLRGEKAPSGEDQSLLCRRSKSEASKSFADLLALEATTLHRVKSAFGIAQKSSSSANADVSAPG
jgi:hypothetical protein